MPEVIPIGADHAGFELKRRLLDELRALGYEPLDMGTDGPESTDYPDYAHQVASRVEHHEARRGVLLCGTGLGMSYAANRHPGVRAAVAWSFLGIIAAALVSGMLVRRQLDQLDLVAVLKIRE